MSIHLFEEESTNGSWEAGKTYSHEFKNDSLLEAIIFCGVQASGGTEVLYETEISIDENGNYHITVE